MQGDENLNSAGVMESGDHFKNGASLKSLMSRGNFLLFACLLFLFFIFTNNAMAWTGNGTSSNPWDISDYSTSGNNVKAYISGSTLYITGSGNMADFWDSTESEAPWHPAYRNAITTVSIPNTVKNIGNRAFKDCSQLQTITIPSSVLIIGRQAFYNCTNTNLYIKIPKEVATIEGEAFRSCSGTLEIEDGDNILNFKSFDYQGNEYPKGLKFEWFMDCQIKTLHLGRNYTFEAWYATDTPFRGMYYLQTLTIGNKVTSINPFAFSNCTNLANVIIEDGLTDLTFTYGPGGDYFNQSPIKTLHLGRNISYTALSGYIPFYEKTSLTTLTIGSNVTSIGYSAFYGCSGLNSPVIIPNSVTSIGISAFDGCVALPAVTIGTNVETIGRNAFYQCRALTSVTIPKFVGEIDFQAFAYCDKLDNLIIEDSASDLKFVLYASSGRYFEQSPIKTLYLGRNISYTPLSDCIPFLGKSSLATLTIGSNVSSIGYSAFEGCTGLTNITIPSNVTSIGNYAFYDCGLTEIHSKNPTPPSVSSNNANCFYNVYNTCKLYVPAGSENKYKEADEWKKFYTILPSAIIPIKANNITIQSHSNGILIETKEPMPVSIYNLSGQKVYESLIAGNAEIGLDKGIYIVKTKNESVKVVVAQ